jgi:hypothetical protein
MINYNKCAAEPHHMHEKLENVNNYLECHEQAAAAKLIYTKQGDARHVAGEIFREEFPYLFIANFTTTS